MEEKWKDFVQKYADEFRRKFKKSIPREDSLLRRNLITVLKRTHGKKLVDVLLFLHRKKELPRIKTNFKVVKIEYELADGEYIELT
jgi:hypothetical protein